MNTTQTENGIPGQEKAQGEKSQVQEKQPIVFRDNEEQPRYEIWLHKYDEYTDFIYETEIIVNKYCAPKPFWNRITQTFYVKADLDYIEITFNTIHHSCNGEGPSPNYFKITLESNNADAELDITYLDSVRKLVNELGVERTVKELLSQLNERIMKYANKFILDEE